MTLRHALPMLLIGLLLLGPAGGALAQGSVPGPQGGLDIPLGPGISYGGRLVTGGAGVTGACDFQFGLWDAANVGTQVGVTQTVSGVMVYSGLFTATLNSAAEFGP